MDDRDADDLPPAPRIGPELIPTSTRLPSLRRRDLEVDLLALQHAPEPGSRRIARGIGREEAERLADRLGRRVAVELFGSQVPGLDPGIGVGAEHRIHRRGDDRGQQRIGLFSGQALGHGKLVSTLGVPRSRSFVARLSRRRQRLHRSQHALARGGGGNRTGR